MTNVLRKLLFDVLVVGGPTRPTGVYGANPFVLVESKHEDSIRKFACSPARTKNVRRNTKGNGKQRRYDMHEQHQKVPFDTIVAAMESTFGKPLGENLLLLLTTEPGSWCYKFMPAGFMVIPNQFIQ